MYREWVVLVVEFRGKCVKSGPKECIYCKMLVSCIVLGMKKILFENGLSIFVIKIRKFLMIEFSKHFLNNFSIP